MKNLFLANKILTILGLLVSLTFWGGIIALPILGLVQIIMCFIIFKNRSKLNVQNRRIFYIYLLITPLLALLFRLAHKFLNINEIEVIFIWMFVSAFLALFHLYITYQIRQS